MNASKLTNKAPSAFHFRTTCFLNCKVNHGCSHPIAFVRRNRSGHIASSFILFVTHVASAHLLQLLFSAMKQNKSSVCVCHLLWMLQFLCHPLTKVSITHFNAQFSGKVIHGTLHVTQKPKLAQDVNRPETGCSFTC